MFDHVSLKVSDFRKSLDFYRTALAPLGLEAQHVDEAGKSGRLRSKGERWDCGSRKAAPGERFTPGLQGDGSGGGRSLLRGGAERVAARTTAKPGRAAGLQRHLLCAAFVLSIRTGTTSRPGHVLRRSDEGGRRPWFITIGTYDIDDPETFRGYPPRASSPCSASTGERSSPRTRPRTSSKGPPDG